MFHPVFRRGLLLVGLSCLGLGLPLPAQDAETVGSEGDLAQLAWLAGAWGERQGGNTAEELWLLPVNGVMLGLHRDTLCQWALFL